MGNRRQPFGYEIRLGKIQPHPIEAPVVKLIHIKYADGMSYLQITAMLNAGSVPYNEPDKPWNKNMVARILGNEIYIGAKGYPQLVDDDVFQQVRKQKPETGQYKDADARTIRSLCKCAACGAKATLRSNRRNWERWHCPSCGFLVSTATIPSVTEWLEKSISNLKMRPQIIRQTADEAASNQIKALEQHLQEALEQEQFDDTYARQIVVELAQARLGAIGAEDYETNRIQQLLTVSAETGTRNMELLPQITSAILIPTSGDIELLMKNGQAIGKGDFEWQ